MHAGAERRTDHELTVASTPAGIVIDLATHGGGAVLLDGVGAASVDASDFLV